MHNAFLADALNTGQIAGAIIGVFDMELLIPAGYPYYTLTCDFNAARRILNNEAME